MKTYTIGELLNAFSDKLYIGYSFKGRTPDRIIICDTDNENRLFWIKSNGESGYDFYFGIADKEEDTRNFVFYHELNDYPEIQKKIRNCILEYMENGNFEETEVK